VTNRCRRLAISAGPSACLRPIAAARLSARAAGIVWAAIIDDRLTVAIKSRLIEDVFGKRVRLGNFDRKIDLGYFLGIYDDGHCKPGPIDSELVATLMKRLEFAKIFHSGPDKITPRRQFDSAATYLLGMLIVAAQEPRPKGTPKKFDFGLPDIE
jgi:hypothetical protein